MAAALVLGSCDRAEPAVPDFPHPRDMALAEPSFLRPDPLALQLRLLNGTVTYVAEDTGVPLVTLTAVVAAGTLQGSVAGAAQVLVAAWQAGGTTSRSRAQVARTLESMAAEFSVAQTAEETILTLNVPREDFRAAVSLFADLLRRPAVNVRDVRTAMAASTPSNSDRYAGSLAGAVDAFHANLYAQHALGRRPGSSGRLTARSAIDFHRRFVTPGSVTLAVGGDVSRGDAEAALVSAFADWGPAEAVERAPAPVLRADAGSDVLLYPVDKLQGWVVMGHELPVIPVEDEAPLQVMNYILGGGHFDTRLFRAARDRRGLTNDNSGFLAPGVRAPGSYTFRTYGRPEVLPLLIHLTLFEIDRIRSTPVNQEELAIAKGALADGEFTKGYRDGPTTALSFAQEWSRYGNHERSSSYQERIRAVTAPDVLAAAQFYLLPQQIDFVIVGPIPQILDAQPLEDELPIRALGSTGGPGAGL